MGTMKQKRYRNKLRLDTKARGEGSRGSMQWHCFYGSKCYKTGGKKRNK